MARRVPNRLPPDEPSVIVDPCLSQTPPPALCDTPSAHPGDDGRLSLLRAVTLIVLSACASYTGVRLLRTQLPSTAHAALVVTPLAPPAAPVPAEPAPVVLALLPAPPAPAVSVAPERVWLQRVQEARAHFAAGRLDQAEALLRAVLRQRAEIPAAQLGLARVRLARGDCSEASALAAAVLARLPQQRGAREVLAACLRVEGTSSAAGTSTRVATALPPNPF